MPQAKHLIMPGPRMWTPLSLLPEQRYPILLCHTDWVLPPIGHGFPLVVPIATRQRSHLPALLFLSRFPSQLQLLHPVQPTSLPISLQYHQPRRPGHRRALLISQARPLASIPQMRVLPPEPVHPLQYGRRDQSLAWPSKMISSPALRQSPAS